MSLEARSSSEKVREDWKSTAKGWRKWDEHIMNWLQPVGDAMVGLAELEDGFVVLDVATGSGEPGLSAARRLGNGRVIGLDISEDMLSTAAEKARRLGIKNDETRLYKGDKFPFGPDSFDAVTCRFGVMFFPDMLGGLKEMVRVVKPGRRVCVAVWGPQNQDPKELRFTWPVLGICARYECGHQDRSRQGRGKGPGEVEARSAENLEPCREKRRFSSF